MWRAAGGRSQKNGRVSLSPACPWFLTGHLTQFRP
jgi:hypothetical protein